MALRFPLSLALAAVLLAGPAAAQYRTLTVEAGSTAKRVALVLGNAAYTGVSSLENPKNDAEDMAAALNAIGFTVFSGTDLTAREMERALRDFSGELTGAEAALVFYAGHGVEVDGVNYLLPVDLERNTEPFELRHEAVSLDRVLDALDRSQVPLKIAVLDACRDNPFRSWRSGSGGWAQTQGPSGTIIAFGTSPGAMASDNPNGRNGLFTASLLEQIATPDIEISRMFRLAAQRVHRESNGAQQPYLSLGYLGDFYLVRSGSAGPPAARPAPAPPPAARPTPGPALPPARLPSPTPPATAEPGGLDARMAQALPLDQAAGLRPQDYAAAQATLTMVAAGGHAEAQSTLGWMRLHGIGAEADPAAGLTLLRAAVAQGHPAAQTNLGFAYEVGLGVPADPAEAARLYGLAADAGRAAAQNNLGTLYERGLGVAQDHAEAARLYRLAAEQGHIGALANLGALTEAGLGVPADVARAADLYEQAALRGDAPAMTRLGVLYRDGRGVAASAARARDWFGWAVEAGDPGAQALLTALDAASADG